MRRVSVLALSLLLTSGVLPVAPIDYVRACTATERATVGCASGDGSSLTIGGERSTESSEPSPENRSDSSTPGHRRSSDLPRPEQNYKTDDCRGLSDRRCARAPLPRTPPESEAAVPAITIADLAIFTPPPATAIAEPGNTGIAGLPANFVATASTQTQTGILFGAPLTVRFTPAGYDFHYGDGTTATLTTGGSTWATLGQPQFTPTPTSHVYRSRGAYTADVTVRYNAEVDLGTGWYSVAGQLSAPGAAQQIRIFDARTALVAHTCRERPAAPGC